MSHPDVVSHRLFILTGPTAPSRGLPPPTLPAVSGVSSSRLAQVLGAHGRRRYRAPKPCPRPPQDRSRWSSPLCRVLRVLETLATHRDVLSCCLLERDGLRARLRRGGPRLGSPLERSM